MQKAGKHLFVNTCENNNWDEMEEMIDRTAIINNIPYIPDDWRFRIEGEKEGWGYRTHLVSQETANLRNKSRRKQRWILVVA